MKHVCSNEQLAMKVNTCCTRNCNDVTARVGIMNSILRVAQACPVVLHTMFTSLCTLQPLEKRTSLPTSSSPSQLPLVRSFMESSTRPREPHRVPSTLPLFMSMVARDSRCVCVCGGDKGSPGEGYSVFPHCVNCMRLNGYFSFLLACFLFSYSPPSTSW